MEKASTPEFAHFIRNVPQIVPGSWCARCQICCRFPAQENVQSPAFSELEVQWAKEKGAGEAFYKAADSPSWLPHLKPCGNGSRCPAFQSEVNRCSIYPVRPLDCRLYPFVLNRDPTGTRTLLSMDKKCPYIEAHGEDPEVAAYALGLARYLETEEGLAYLQTNPRLVGKSWPEFVPVAAFPAMNQSLVEPPPEAPDPKLQALSVQDAVWVREFLKKKPHTHSSYTVAGLLGWSDLIRIWQAQLKGGLCLFAQQAGAFYMPLPPLADRLSPAALRASWEIMTRLNQGSGVSRVEGIEPDQVPLFQSEGFKVNPQEPEYLYDPQELVGLKGDRYRSKRWAINKALKALQGRRYLFRPFKEQDVVPCLTLYTHWAIARQWRQPQPYAKALIRDGLFFHRRLMLSCQELGLEGWVLEVEGKILGYTFGAAVSPDLFSIFLEITQRRVTGLSQLIFQEFCRRLTSYRWVNAMGDSDLAGLRRAKESYYPAAMTLTYKTNGRD